MRNQTYATNKSISRTKVITHQIITQRYDFYPINNQRPRDDAIKLKKKKDPEKIRGHELKTKLIKLRLALAHTSRRSRLHESVLYSFKKRI